MTDTQEAPYQEVEAEEDEELEDGAEGMDEGDAGGEGVSGRASCYGVGSSWAWEAMGMRHSMRCMRKCVRPRRALRCTAALRCAACCCLGVLADPQGNRSRMRVRLAPMHGWPCLHGLNADGCAPALSPRHALLRLVRAVGSGRGRGAAAEYPVA
jgi:hypothetical protein